jgi:UDP-N-acetylmuramoyl-L-alanyl-D-glutamate--2,6-diaminopimelate ligase
MSRETVAPQAQEASVKARVALRLSELLARAGRPDCVPADTACDPLVSGLTHDSRAVEEGFLFVALRGARDGADFAARAVEAGAAAVLAASEDRRLGVPWLQVADDRAALADCAAALAGEPSTRMAVTGITGTNGKTTTSWMLDSILEAAGRPSGLVGTLGARWPGGERPSPRTTPEAPDLQEMLVDMERAGCVHAVVEVSSHAIDLERVRGLRFAALGFTNLTQDHLDWHGDLESYFATKRRLFTELGPAAPAVVCADDAHGRRLAEELRAADPRRTVLTCGFGESCDLRVAAFAADSGGARLTLRGAGLDFETRLLSPARHDAKNAVLAAGLALALGIDGQGIAAGLASCGVVPGRLERAAGDDQVGVYVDFAHAPGALVELLDSAREFTRGRLICVFGCGGDKDRSKRAVMGEAVGLRADLAIATSDNPRSEDPLAILAMVAEGLARTGAETREIADRREAIRAAIEEARPGDVILVAGKGHESEQEIGGQRLPFDDRQVVRELWEELKS